MPLLHDVRDAVIKDRCARRKLRLTEEATSGRIIRKTVQMEIKKRIVGSGLDIVEGSVHFETK